MKYLAVLIILVMLFSGCAGTRSIISDRFKINQAELIMSGNGTPMRVLSIYDKKDSLVLRSKSEDILPDTTDAILDNLINRMYATVNDSLTLGVGIAAPQVGILKKVIWVQRYDRPGYPFEVYLNPEIVQYTKKKLNWIEGCLSVPGKKDTTTTRSFAVLLKYLRRDGSSNIEMVEGFTAVIFQHEIDHLNGIIYLDRLK